LWRDKILWETNVDQYLNQSAIQPETRLAMIASDNPSRVKPGFWGAGRGVNRVKIFPLPVQIRRKWKGQKLNRLRFPLEWLKYYRDLNEKDLESAFRMTNGTINRGSRQQIDYRKIDQFADPKEGPMFEMIIYGCNPVIVDELIADSHGNPKGIKIATFKPGKNAPDARLVNYKTSIYVHSFTAIHENGSIHGLGICGRYADNYYFAINDSDCWINMKDSFTNHRIELFPRLPMSVTVLVERGLNIRSAPSTKGKILETLAYETSIDITQYFPTMGDIWGLTRSGWLPLRYQPIKASAYYSHYTTWQMQTPAPVRPMHPIPGELPGISSTPEPPPQTTKSCQDVINAFYWGLVPQFYDRGEVWSKVIEPLGLSWLADDRSAVYTGSPIDEFDELSELQKQAIKEKLFM
jgi:hypothetical protein